MAGAHHSPSGEAQVAMPFTREHVLHAGANMSNYFVRPSCAAAAAARRAPRAHVCCL